MLQSISSLNNHHHEKIICRCWAVRFCAHVRLAEASGGTNRKLPPIKYPSLLVLFMCLPLSPLFSFFQINILYAFLISPMCYMPHATHAPFHHTSNVSWRVQIMSCSKCSFLLLPVISYPLDPNILLSPVLYNTTHSMYRARDEVSYLHKATHKSILLYE
jgi:hypothetical protein